ncbi:hypothetical protein ACRTDU_03920 [Sunxiuqinia elliptica]
MKYNFLKAGAPSGKGMTDPWYQKTMLTVAGTMLPFKVGDEVTIESNLYKGTHEIGYIYKGYSNTLGTVWNLYFKSLDFKGSDNGTVEIAVDQPEPTPTTVTEPASEEKTVSQDTSKEPANQPVSKKTPETVQSISNKVVTQAKSAWQNKWVQYLVIGIVFLLILRILKK